MKIIYFHIPSLQDYMIPTKKWLDEMSQHYDIIDVTTPPNENRMYEGLVENWNVDDLVICGQDNVGSLEMLYEYEKCGYDVCSNPCLMYEKSTGRGGIVQNMISTDDNSRFMHPKDSTLKFCNGVVGTGLSRISKRLQSKIDITGEPFHFQNFDHTLSKLFNKAGVNLFHLHYPIHTHMKK